MTTPKKPAVEVEAEAVDDSVFVIEWEGITMKVPAIVDEWDPDALEAFEQGQAITAIRKMLGSDEYDRVRNEYAMKKGKRPNVGALGDLLEMIAQHYGFRSQGESRASSA